ncbi:kinase-like domain-containing protein [Rhizophagus clarus]|uniref:Kinase-like domain-containing protein n=1 Tax=Rhizophagus clarus TaxID=94130 RepID=A0A8H3LPR0_9GLOM|nr:kinase-like domain-containing protein [Rhizophagus clarus]
MTDIRNDVIWAAYNRAYSLLGCTIQDLDEQYGASKQTVLADESLTKDEKSEVIKLLNKDQDDYKIRYNEGTKRICENCQDECFATYYCEHCVRNYLKENFSNWTSGNNDIDDLIQKCQIETFRPDRIIEWIPYNNLQNVEYLTKGGYSEIYTATWIDGNYDEWDSKEKQLKRSRNLWVILKELENVESANRSWFEESKTHLTISNKWGHVIRCRGLTKNLSNGNYMLVIDRMKMDLRTYLRQNHNILIWKERIQIAFDIIDAIVRIHVKQCWDADPIKRPNAKSLRIEMRKLLLYFQNNQNESQKQTEHQQSLNNYYMNNSIYSMSENCTSKIYQFKNLPEPKNATEEEQEEFHSKPYSFNIPDNIDDFNNSSNEKNIITKSNSVNKVFEKLEINSNCVIQNGHKKENAQQSKKHSLDINDDNDVNNDSNVHLEKQDDLEISNGNVSKKIRTS